jgi:hypothetical protein
MQNDVIDDVRHMLMWHDLDADVDILHVKKINLNNFY